MSSPQFKDLALIEPIQKAIEQAGYTTPTPIQMAAIPHLLEGRDLLGCAQTGTGKTAAFALPILSRLAQNHHRAERKQARVLVLTPTRELAIQIYDSFRTYGRNLRLSYAVVFGGVNQNPQVKSVAQGVDILVATPGRLMDLIGQKHLALNQLEVFVLDEADRMLDMGFIHAIRKIIALLPSQRHSLFFSATMPPDIERLAASMLKNPVRIEVTPPSSTVEKVKQSVMYVDRDQKRSLLLHVLQDRAAKRVIVFTRTKHGANRVSETLEKNGIPSAAIHGNKSQAQRQKALENFRMGRCRVLVATDIAARGIDIDDITHVINYEIPNESESYVHRIGRTARAGASGVAISFCDSDERSFIRDIERLIGQPIPVITDQPHHSENVASAQLMSKGKAKARIEGDRRPQRSRRPGSGGGGRRHGQGASGPRRHGSSAQSSRSAPARKQHR